MIRKKNEQVIELRSNMRGGQGDVKITHYFKKDEINAPCRFCAQLELAPGVVGEDRSDLDQDVAVVLGHPPLSDLDAAVGGELARVALLPIFDRLRLRLLGRLGGNEGYNFRLPQNFVDQRPDEARRKVLAFQGFDVILGSTDEDRVAFAEDIGRVRCDEAGFTVFVYFFNDEYRNMIARAQF